MPVWRCICTVIPWRGLYKHRQQGAILGGIDASDPLLAPGIGEERRKATGNNRRARSTESKIAVFRLVGTDLVVTQATRIALLRLSSIAAAGRADPVEAIYAGCMSLSSCNAVVGEGQIFYTRTRYARSDV